MSLEENSATYKPLPVVLQSNWSLRLPKVIWRAFDLTPDNSNVSILDQSSLSLAEALTITQHQVEYLDFLLLAETLENLELEGQITSLEQTFHYRWNDEAKSLLNIFKTSPENFKKWVLEKKLKFSDLRPLFRADFSQISSLLNRLSQIQASKHTGCEILERLCDLEDVNPKEFESLSSSKDWLGHLDQLSRPLTLSKDQQRQEKVKSWSWPSRMKGEWKRQGDQAGLKVELYSLNPNDLQEKLKTLQGFCEKWKSEL